MKVLINAASIKEGGSQVVLTRLLSAMAKIRPDIEWIVAAHPGCVASGSKESSVNWLPALELEGSVLGTFKWYELTLPALIRKYRPDVLFSQTNYLPRRPLACPTLLLIQHAGHFSPEFDRLTTASLSTPLARWIWQRKRRWVHNSAAAATLVTVQTRALAQSISAQAKLPPNQITVIPHGPGLASHRSQPQLRPKANTFRIGYITKWGVQKNFQTLFAAAAGLLAKRGRALKIVLTLNQASAHTEKVIAAARNYGIESSIENHGELPFEDIPSLYDSLDVFVFASLCESFGFPAVEAMARGLPIIVANTPENIEVTRGAALAFDSLDASALAQHLATIMDDDQERTKRARLSLTESRNYSWDKAALETIAALKAARQLQANRS